MLLWGRFKFSFFTHCSVSKRLASSEKNSAFAYARLSVSAFVHSPCGSRHSEVTGHSGSQHTGQCALLTESIRRSKSDFWSSGAATMTSPYGLEPFTFCSNQQFLAVWPGLLQRCNEFHCQMSVFVDMCPVWHLYCNRFFCPFQGIWLDYMGCSGVVWLPSVAIP